MMAVRRKWQCHSSSRLPGGTSRRSREGCKLQGQLVGPACRAGLRDEVATTAAVLRTRVTNKPSYHNPLVC